MPSISDTSFMVFNTSYYKSAQDNYAAITGDNINYSGPQLTNSVNMDYVKTYFSYYNEDYMKIINWVNDTTAANLDSFPGANYSSDGMISDTSFMVFNTSYYKSAQDNYAAITGDNTNYSGPQLTNSVNMDYVKTYFSYYNEDYMKIINWVNDTTAANLDSFPGANYSSDEPIETTNITKYLKLLSTNLYEDNVRNDLYIDVSNIPNKESYMLSHNLYSDLSNGAITDISFSLFIDYSNNLDVSMLSDTTVSVPTLDKLKYTDTNTNVTQGITWFRSEVDISSDNIGPDISWVHIATFDISNTQMDLSMRYLYGAPSLLYGDSDADISAQSFIQYFDCSNGVLKFKN